MPLDWVTAGKIALAAGQALLGYLQGKDDDAERARDRERILAAIQQSTDEVLARLNLLEVDRLRGELEGFHSIYASYDPDPDDPAEEERLVRLSDESARVLGQLGAHLDSLPRNPDLAFEAWAIYIPLLYLRAQAMAEREITYGADETADALESFDKAIPRLTSLLAHLRQQSDGLFGPVVCKPMPDSQDSRVCWYWWRHGTNAAEQVICGSTRDPRGVEKCQQSRARTMENAYRSFPGVAEITAVLEQLHDARDALDTTHVLDVLVHHGIDVGEVVMVQGRFARAPSTGRLRTTDTVRALEPDWFS